MPRFKPKGMLERDAAEDLWKKTLQKIPTLYGRLAYLGSLRDPVSGIYRHYGFSAAYGREESGKALRQSHEQVFGEWLNLPFPDRYRDLLEYLAGLDESRQVILVHWLRDKPYRSLPPSAALEMERELFVTDIEAIIETVKNGLPAEEPGRASSPPE